MKEPNRLNIITAFFLCAFIAQCNSQTMRIFSQAEFLDQLAAFSVIRVGSYLFSLISTEYKLMIFHSDVRWRLLAAILDIPAECHKENAGDSWYGHSDPSVHWSKCWRVQGSMQHAMLTWWCFERSERFVKNYAICLIISFTIFSVIIKGQLYPLIKVPTTTTTRTWPRWTNRFTIPYLQNRG